MWRCRYRHKYTAFQVKDVEEGACSKSEKFSATLPVRSWSLKSPLKESTLSNSKGASSLVPAVQSSSPLRRRQINNQAPYLNTTQRPTRDRKPAQRDPTMLNWSEAVATIESLDPDLHSSLLQDVQRADPDAPFRYAFPASLTTSMKSGETVASQESSNEPAQKSSAIKTPHKALQSSHSCLGFEELDELAADHPPRSRASVPTNSSLCTFGDCASSTKSYRLRRRQNEEISPMCLHLLQAHQITPYPCKEPFCDRTGLYGFCLQVDLVRHVQLTHPSPAALDRLQGRVSSSYLVKEYQIMNLNSSPNVNRPIPPISEPDFTKVLSDSDQQHDFSSSPPGKFFRTDLGLPPTGGLSSNSREHDTSNLGGESLLDSRSGLPQEDISLGYRSMEERSLCTARNVLNQPQSKSDKKQNISATISETQSLRASKKSEKKAVQALPRNRVDPSYEFSDDEDSQHISRTFEPTKNADMQSTLSQETGNHIFERSNDTSHAAELTGIIEQLKEEVIEGEDLGHHTIESTDTLLIQKESQAGGAIEHPGERAAVENQETPPVVESNVDKLGLRTPGNQKAPQEAPSEHHSTVKVESTDTPELAGKGTFSGQKPSFTTPTNQKQKPRTSILKNIACSDDMDELSPCADDFVFLHSRPRSGLRFGTGSQCRIKREDAVDVPTSVLPRRKRKFASLVEDDEIDELVGDEPIFLLSVTNRPKRPSPTKIKKDTNTANAREPKDAAPTSVLQPSSPIP